MPTEAEEIKALQTGRWRPNVDFTGVHGLRVVMQEIRGTTPGSILRVPFRFQVPPLNDFQRRYQFEHARFKTLRFGERSRPDGKTLITTEISTMFLDAFEQVKSNVAIWPYKPVPQRMIRELRHVMNTGAIFQLVVAQPSIWPQERLLQMSAVLTNLQATQKPGEPGTEYIDATFEESVPLEVSRRSSRAENGTRKHKLARADTLHKLGKRYYRSSSLWRTIAKANGIKGVAPGSADNLRGWAKRHRKTHLKIPPRPRK